MAGELVETSRLWGRDLGRIEPEWVEPLAEHLVKRTYSEPHWSARNGAVMAYERVTLYGVPIVAGRRVTYDRIDPELSRELFIRHALVQGEWRTHHAFFHENRALLDDVEELEHRARRRDILVDDETLVDFYDQRVPADVVSARHFDAWWKKARRETPDLLTFDPAMLVREDAGRVEERDYPDAWRQGDLRLPLTYQFEPGAAADGVTVHVPLQVLNRLAPAGFDWQVPGLRADLVTALIKSLPKALRRSFVPAPDTARAVLERIDGRAGERPLTDAMADELRRMTGVVVPHDAWDLARVPGHLRLTFRVEDDGGTVVAEGKDLDALKTQLAPTVREAVAAAAADLERGGLTSWTFGDLPDIFEQRRDGHPVKGFPALVDEGATVGLRVLGSAEERDRETRRGVRRLLTLTVPSPLKHVVGRLDTQSKLALGHNPHGSVPALLADCLDAAVDALMAAHGGPVTDQASFDRLREKVRAELPETTYDVVVAVAGILALAHDVSTRVSGAAGPAVLPSLVDVRGQVARLVRPGFVTQTGQPRLRDLRRYLRAVQVRLDALPNAVARDQARMAEVAAVQAEVDAWLAAMPPSRRDDPSVRQVAWMVEELRVSLFAQQLGTPYPVSAKRIHKAMDSTLPQ
jgi:ATP-dependent helicase HrpA